MRAMPGAWVPTRAASRSIGSPRLGRLVLPRPGYNVIRAGGVRLEPVIDFFDSFSDWPRISFAVGELVARTRFLTAAHRRQAEGCGRRPVDAWQRFTLFSRASRASLA